MAIIAPMHEDFEIEELDREEVKAFYNKFEKEIEGNRWSDILAKIVNISELQTLKKIFDIILEENLLEKIDYIPSDLYKNDTSLEEISIPASIKRIEENAFKNCKNLKKVVMDDSVTEIGSNIFDGCVELKELKLSNSLTEIPNNAFKNCKSLRKLFIPNSVNTMKYDVFSGCADDMVLELNHVKRSENTEKPYGINMKTSTADFYKKHRVFIDEK